MNDRNDLNEYLADEERRLMAQEIEADNREMRLDELIID